MDKFVDNFFFISTDLKAFERRLTEVISCVHPSTVRWRSMYTISLLIYARIFFEKNKKTNRFNTFDFAVMLTIMSIITSVGAWHWLTDPKTAVVPLTESLLNHSIYLS